HDDTRVERAGRNGWFISATGDERNIDRVVGDVNDAANGQLVAGSTGKKIRHIDERHSRVGPVDKQCERGVALQVQGSQFAARSGIRDVVRDEQIPPVHYRDHVLAGQFGKAANGNAIGRDHAAGTNGNLAVTQLGGVAAAVRGAGVTKRQSVIDLEERRVADHHRRIAIAYVALR